MSSYILALFKSIGEFAVEAAAAALKMDACYSQVNRFFFTTCQQWAKQLWGYGFIVVSLGYFTFCAVLLNHGVVEHDAFSLSISYL